MLKERRVMKPQERSMQVWRIIDPDEGLVAFSLSGTGTFAIKHLVDGKANGCVKACWLSNDKVKEALADSDQEAPKWLIGHAWYHFRGITTNDNQKDMEDRYDWILDQVRQVTVSGTVKIQLEIEENEHRLVKGEDGLLVLLWPEVRE